MAGKMGEVEEGVALKPPGGTDATSAEPSDGSPHCLLVVLHAPSRKGLGAKLEIHPPRFTIGTLHDDLAVEGAQESGTRAEVAWAAQGEVPSEGGWIFRGVGRVSVNDEPAIEHTLRLGDQLRVVNTYFRFLPSSALPDAYHVAIYHMTILHIPSGAHNHRYLTEAFSRDQRHAARHGRDLSLGLISIDARGEVNEGLLGPLVRQLRQVSDQWLTACTGPTELVVVANQPAASLEAELAHQARSSVPGNARVRVGVVHSTPDASLDQLLRTARTNLLPLTG